MSQSIPDSVRELLPRQRDLEYTRVLLVTLPEATSLQVDDPFLARRDVLLKADGHGKTWSAAVPATGRRLAIVNFEHQRTE